MRQKLREYLRRKTENISFIELKKGTSVDINGYKVTYELPLPILINELVSEIKEGRAQEEIQMKAVITGMIYVLGVDPDFRYVEKYKEILYKYTDKIEDFILYCGLKLVEDKNYEDALVYFSSLVNLNSKNIGGLYNLALVLEEKAQIYFKNKDAKRGNIFLKESTNCFEEILDIDPSFSAAYYKLGYHYRAQKQFIKSKFMWEKFLDYPHDEDSVNEIKQQLLEISDEVTYEEGYTEIFRGNSEVGLQKLLPLQERYSDWWNLLFMIGLAYRQLGDYKNAKDQFEKVIAIYPDQVDSLNELGLCHAVEENFSEAIDIFSKALKIKPDDHEILCNRGMTYLQMGDLNNGKKDIEKAYNINPEDEITIACKNHLNEYIEGTN